MRIGHKTNKTADIPHNNATATIHISSYEEISMKILVVGTGSIGQRHIHNLRTLGVDVLAYSYRRASIGGINNALPPDVTWIDDWQHAIDTADIQAVVLANRTDLHVEVALAAAQRGLALFIEKPLSNRLNDTDKLLHTVKSRNIRVEAGFMLRCHPNLQWLKIQLQENVLGRILYARANVGQWLPDWRPNSDHRTGYGAYKATGGGVIFDLVHELDLMHWLLGSVTQVTAMTTQHPALEIETEAIAQIGLRFASGALAQVHLDYVRPDYGRNMEIVCANGVYTWDYLAGKVYAQARGQENQLVHQVPDGFQRNDLFLQHMRAFISGIKQSEQPILSPLPDALAVLKVALAAHQSAESRRHVLLGT